MSTYGTQNPYAKHHKPSNTTGSKGARASADVKPTAKLTPVAFSADRSANQCVNDICGSDIRPDAKRGVGLAWSDNYFKSALSWQFASRQGVLSLLAVLMLLSFLYYCLLLSLSLSNLGVAVAIFLMFVWIKIIIVRHYALAVIMITPLTIFLLPNMRPSG